MNTLSKPTQDMLAALREWGLTHVRPLAREADRLHRAPPGALEVLSHAPARMSLDGGKAAAGSKESLGMIGGLVAEAMAFGDVWAIFSGGRGGGLGNAVVQGMGTPAQKERWLKAVNGRPPSGAFALTEPHFGSDPCQAATTPRRGADTGLLTGTKWTCGGGPDAAHALALPTTAKKACRTPTQPSLVGKG